MYLFALSLPPVSFSRNPVGSCARSSAPPTTASPPPSPRVVPRSTPPPLRPVARPIKAAWPSSRSSRPQSRPVSATSWRLLQYRQMDSLGAESYFLKDSSADKGNVEKHIVKVHVNNTLLDKRVVPRLRESRLLAPFVPGARVHTT